ncbi:RNA polymerase sigma factor [Streptomyces sp. NPDC012600]|uniref:RNA polymerase sigma factor n=2 Tax=Streptomycetaceae TaxID=2062 RepID=A0ABU2WA30_9ACTN|nr:RNA polymerase sigma factor [Streptomyces griseus]ARF74876.1 hypothetical protein B7C62_23560 [Kitasatospora albolonga]MDT0494169.1 RNA polymerase sigma factor [Streptomyces griseus]
MATQTSPAPSPKPQPQPTDGELARRAADGEHRAFAELVARHQPRLLALCRRITRDDHDAHDALQNALLAAWQRMGSYENRSSVGTWLSRVAINSSLDELRRRGRRPAPAPELPLPVTPTASDDPMTTRVALLWAMDQLPPHTRDTVLLRDHYGLSYQEIAEHHHTSTDAVRARLARGRRALAGLLDSPRRRGPARPLPESPAPCDHGR